MGAVPKSQSLSSVSVKTQSLSLKGEAATSILQRIQSRQFEQLAQAMRRDIGIPDADWERMQPRNAVISFMGRYTNSGEALQFEHSLESYGCRATLLTPSFNERSFSGCCKDSRGRAEEAACEVFKRDPQVNEARKWLPPSMQKIRDRVSLDGTQKAELRRMGMDTTLVQSSMWRCIFNGFRHLGCCTAKDVFISADG